jgi:hypothetical protein
MRSKDRREDNGRLSLRESSATFAERKATIAVISLFLLADLPDLRNDPVLLYLLPQVRELGRRFAGRVPALSSHCSSSSSPI